MSYLANHFEKRCNPQLLLEGTRTVISVALNYYPTQLLTDDQYQFAWYAYGHDYHEVMREKLTALLQYVKEQFAGSGRLFCDTAPVLERYWAWQAGVGFIGKHTQLIIPQAGSCFFLGELFINLEADSYDHPQVNRCGTCTQCLDACPTHALEHQQLLNPILPLRTKPKFQRSYPPSLAIKSMGATNVRKHALGIGFRYLPTYPN
jgi:epoxyqueuosine reductase